MTTQSPRSLRLALLWLLTPPLLCGCSAPGTADSGDGRNLTPSDFRAQTGDEPVELAVDDSTPVLLEPVPERLPRTWQTLSIGPDLTAAPLAGPDERVTQSYLTAAGSPEANPGGSSVASPTLIDAKVGDINGRPIYASEFLEPMAARFRAEAIRLPEAAWQKFVRDSINDMLHGIITDELLRAEALARLSPQQRQGLRALLEKTRTQFMSQNLGSEKLTEERIRSEYGKSLNERIAEQQETMLIRHEYNEVIFNRVNVSWRDVQHRYLRDFERFNPDPVAVFRLIRVPVDETETVEGVTRRLGEGEPFETIATEPLNGYNTDKGGVVQFSFNGDFAAQSFFNPEPIKDASRALTPGEHAGPIPFGSSVYWIRLEAVNVLSVSLYDAQLVIERELLEERRTAERERYIARLIKRARVNNREEIIESLYNIAIERFGSEQ